MNWFEERGWQPFDFQREVWAAMAQGKSGLLHSSTGSGKTLAAFFGVTQALQPKGLTALWITPMRALAADTERALKEAGDLVWTIGRRTGDTSATERAKQQRKPPNALITTPESLTLLLAQADARERLGRVQAVVVDEWHELLGSKRGLQLQLALARLRGWNPELMTWGLSATLGNLDEALHQLVGARGGVLVRGAARKALDVQTLLPPKPERFAWAGHLGLSMLPAVVEALDSAASTLVFTNTRAQSELWYQALLDARPDWAGLIALHHGSLDAKVRDWVESATKAGQLRAVVCTSSLDLGVDFLPVEQVLQVGSAKSLARLLQRAGRSGHAPGRASQLRLVPTHSLELLEAAAVQTLLTGDPPDELKIETRTPPAAPLDVLVQHLCTVALGGGFRPDELLREVRSAPAYAQLSDADWAWALAFVRQGGDSLAAYPDFHRVQVSDDGLWHLPDARLARRHRANIGTLSSEASVTVQFLGGAKLGQVEEGFIARMKPGDVFLFAGRALELVRVKEMTAYVRKAKSSAAAVPRWAGGRMSLSPFLGAALREQVSAAAQGDFTGPEMQALRPLLELQARWSALPRAGELLLEHWSGREGHALALYPFAGRAVHSALAAWLAWALGRAQPNSFSLAVTEYGLLLLAAEPVDWATALPPLLRAAPSTAQLEADLAASLNAGELARRRFRDIARVAGLVFQSHPGERRTARQLQASSGLYFDVFTNHDPGNLLLRQAREEALRDELDLPGLHALLQRLRGQTLLWREPGSATPFSFPLVVERWRERLSTETLNQRIAREVGNLEKRAESKPSLKRRTG